METINWNNVLVVLATSLGAIATIVGAVNKLVVHPTKTLLNKYDNKLKEADERVDEANKKLEGMSNMVKNMSETYIDRFKEMDDIIEKYRQDIEDSKDDLDRLRTSVRALLRAMLYSEITKSLCAGYRTDTSTQRIYQIYDAYKKMGLNGLGVEYYNIFKDLPLVEGNSIIVSEKMQGQKGESEDED